MVTFWLTYVNSLINPFLYAFSSVDLRNAVVKIIKCRCTSMWRLQITTASTGCWHHFVYGSPITAATCDPKHLTSTNPCSSVPKDQVDRRPPEWIRTLKYEWIMGLGNEVWMLSARTVRCLERFARTTKPANHRSFMWTSLHILTLTQFAHSTNVTWNSVKLFYARCIARLLERCRRAISF